MRVVCWRRGSTSTVAVWLGDKKMGLLQFTIAARYRNNALDKKPDRVSTENNSRCVCSRGEGKKAVGCRV